MQEVRREVLRLEFSDFDLAGEGRVTAYDFARLVVCRLDTSTVQDYEKRAQPLRFLGAWMVDGGWWMVDGG